MIEDLVNRLRKRQKHLRKWARRRDICCYRLYEKDLPDQPLIIDWYDGDVVLWTLQRTRNETDEQEQAWVLEVCDSVIEALDLNPRQLFLKQRRRQYEKYGRSNHTKVVSEGGLKFEINFSDYLDLGLFLDHRPLRQHVRDQASDKRILNCFCYTGSFSVNAAAGGASHVCSIDLSNTYLDWMRRNLDLNDLPHDIHDIRKGDCLDELRDIASGPSRFDIIVCDPPTFSNSKSTENDFIIQDKHVPLINACMRCLVPDGALYFSTNFRKFKMDAHITERYQVEEITAMSIPEDFRNERIHYCWEIRK